MIALLHFLETKWAFPSSIIFLQFTTLI